MRTLIAGLLDRVLPETCPDEDFFMAAPARTRPEPQKSSARQLSPTTRQHHRRAVGLGRQRHA
jgi:hypothetical protein